jgi:beta-glucosidase
MSVIDDRVRDILRVKFLVGLFDRPYQMELVKADEVVDGAANNEWALRASRESIVLLKNKDNILPLDAAKLAKVAVIGPNADETSYANTHYGPLMTNTISVFKGLQTALAGKAQVVYSKGCELVDANWPDSEIMPFDMTPEASAMMAEAVKVAAESDVIVAVMGGGQRTCGENKSRSSIELPGDQNKLLMELKKTGKPLIVVLINGRPLSVNWANAHADAILEAWYPGSHGGTALAEVILGDYNPGGKLTVTFPKTVGQIPFNFPYKPNSQVDGNSKPGINGNQSRVNGSLYDFGYGLSYTTFEYGDLQISKKKILPTESVTISFTVTNTGSRKGDEVAQLYFTDKISSVTVYEKQLRGFERVTLEPGETKTVTMTLDAQDFALLDNDMNSVVEPGEFDIFISASSTDVRLKDTIIVTDKDGNVVGCEEYPDDASKVASKFPATIGVSEDVTMPLKDEERIETLTIHWEKDSDCDFEILTTNGGGQFLPVYKGTVKGARVQICKFERTRASEVRVGVIRGKGTVKKLESPSLR